MPRWGLRYPSQVSSVVVLPAPLGPSTAVIVSRLDLSDELVDGDLVAVPHDQAVDDDGGGGG